jgi:hypothetical protein
MWTHLLSIVVRGTGPDGERKPASKGYSQTGLVMVCGLATSSVSKRSVYRVRAKLLHCIQASSFFRYDVFYYNMDCIYLSHIQHDTTMGPWARLAVAVH